MTGRLNSPSPQLRLAHRFDFAARDMEDVAETARWLASNALTKGVRGAVVTGLVATYARPFTKQGVGDD
jgi:hypothetical protein